MAEPLVSQFGEDIPRRIGAALRAAHPRFDRDGFVASVLDGYDELNLMARGRRIGSVMGRFLPQDFDKAAAIVLASLDKRVQPQRGMDASDGSLASFFYLPHTLFVAEYGLGHFDTSMRLQYELTQRFTAEFSMRAFLLQHTQATLDRLTTWADDDNEHVRRLVSESTRPRLPWAQRLPLFQRNPKPVLGLLELLKDDPSLYVRRSVANNLNDIGKDNADQLMKTMRRWSRGATPQREWLIRHALRSAIKRGSPDALDILGFGSSAVVRIDGANISPQKAARGKHISIGFAITSTAKKTQQVLVDFRIHYVKANGSTSAKVFKLKTLELAPGETVQLAKKVSLAEMTTRKHYPGEHAVDVQVNGNVFALGSFFLK